MRMISLALAAGAGALALGLATSDAYAGAVKVNCSGTTTEPVGTVKGTPPCLVATGGSSTTQVDPGPGPSGPTTGGTGAIQAPDSTFTGDGLIDHGIGPTNIDPPLTVGSFLGSSGLVTNSSLTFSNPNVTDDVADDTLYQFGGKFSFTDGFTFAVDTNAGGASNPAEVLLFINGVDVLDSTVGQTATPAACNDVVTPTQNQNTASIEFTDSIGANFCDYTFTQAAGSGTDDFVLDYYSGIDAPYVFADAAGSILSDTAGSVPEPVSLSLFGAALLGLGLVRRLKAL